MELFGLIEKVEQILDEERLYPTVRYSPRLIGGKANDATAHLADSLTKMTGIYELQQSRSQRPRKVQEKPGKWQLESVNYSLLCALASRTAEDARSVISSSALNRLTSAHGYRRSNVPGDPSWNGFVSEYPLIAEFCIRNGARRDFFRVLGELDPSPGHAVLLRHLEEMIALNFTALTEQDYRVFDTAITSFENTAKNLYESEGRAGRTRGEKAQLSLEIIEASEGIREECRKARYLYLKGDLIEGFNLEVNQDKVTVENYLKAQGFSDDLIECLGHADRIYQGASSGFEFKSSMAHLRSFMKRLNSEGLVKLQITVPGPKSRRWGNGLTCMQQRGVLSKAEEAYAAALFTLLSDEGVHPIFAEKEYARLARNVVIEYALLFLRRLEKVAPKLAKSRPRPRP